MIDKTRNLLGRSGTVLVVTNVLPLLFVLLFDWDVFFLIALYWMENVIIGLLNIVRFFTILVLNKAWEAILMIPFFAIHYGMFTFVHGIFVVVLFGKGEVSTESGEFWSVLSTVLSQPGMVVAAIGLFASHLVSYFLNFLNNGEYQRTTVNNLMSAPYKRVVILHITILFGGFLVMSTGEHIAALILLIVLKIGLDLFAHSGEHQPSRNQIETHPSSA